jgi:hypothetical protein
MKKNLLYGATLVGLIALVTGSVTKRAHDSNLVSKQSLTAPKQQVCDQACDPDRSSDLTPLTRLLFKAW